MPRKQSSKISFKDSRIPVVSQKTTNNAQEDMRLMTDEGGVIIYANDELAREIGIPADDLRNRHLLDSLFFKDIDKITNDKSQFNTASSGQDDRILGVNDGLHELLIGHNQTPYKFYFNWINGQDNRRFLVASSVKSDDVQKWQSILHQTDGYPSITQDNSDHVATNTQTQFLDEDDAILFAQINRDIMCVLSNDWHLTRKNKQCDDVLPLTQKQSFLDIIHDDDKPLVRQYLQSFNHHDSDGANTQHSVEFESRIISNDQNIIVMRWDIHRHGQEYFCTGNDITSSHNNEGSLNKIRQELYEAQALANMGHWRWLVGSDTISWSDQIYKIFGVSRDNFTPSLDNANNRLHKRDIGHMMQAFQRALIEQNDYDIDFRVVHDDGAIRYVRCEGRCEMGVEGDVLALYGVMQDVTEQAENEMALRSAKDSAEHAYASKSRFLANMSHELRTPLNAIIGFSDMMKRQMLGPLGNDKYMEYADSIHSSGEHLLSLITDILDMSKIEAGKYDLDLETIQLGDVVSTAVRMIESRAQEGVITLDNQVDGDGPNIVADRRAVMQIMLNILSNAVKFTEPGGEITISIEERDTHISIKVVDTGIGIPANKLSAVLKPFEQVSTAFTRNHEGSGLGLAITKELTEMHGGLITLDSKEGSGTTALLRLPRDARLKVHQ